MQKLVKKCEQPNFAIPDPKKVKVIAKVEKDESVGKKKKKKSKNKKKRDQNKGDKGIFVRNVGTTEKPVMIFKTSSPFHLSPPPEKATRDCPTPDLSTASSESEPFDEPLLFEAITPAVKKPRQPPKKWSAFEDQTLMEAQAIFGKQWNETMKLLPERTKVSAQHRWRSKPYKDKVQQGEIVASEQVKRFVYAHAVEVAKTNARVAEVLSKRTPPIPDPTPSSKPTSSPNAVGDVSLQKRAPAHISTAVAAAAPKSVEIKTVGSVPGSLAPPPIATNAAGQRGPPPMLPPALPPVEPPAKKQKIGPPPTAAFTAVQASLPVKKEQQIVGVAKPQPWSQPGTVPAVAASVVVATKTNLVPLYGPREEVVAETVFGTIPVVEPNTVIHQRPLRLGSRSAAKATSAVNRRNIISLASRPFTALHLNLQWDFDDPASDSVDPLTFDHVLEDAYHFGAMG